MVDNTARVQRAASMLGVKPEDLESTVAEVFPEVSDVISMSKAAGNNNCNNNCKRAV